MKGEYQDTAVILTADGLWSREGEDSACVFHGIELLEYIRSLGIMGSYVDIGRYAIANAVYYAMFCSPEKVYAYTDKEEDIQSAKKDFIENNIEALVDIEALSFSGDDSSVASSIDKLVLNERVSLIALDGMTEALSILQSIHEVVQNNKPLIFIRDGLNEPVNNFLKDLGYTVTGKVSDKGSWSEFTHFSFGHKKYFDVATYWEKRYLSGRNSGSGSYANLARFKARFLNRLVVQEEIKSVIELGCGDGAQLSLANYPEYVGFDVSPKAIDQCKKRYSNDKTKAFHIYADKVDLDEYQSELVLSLDVIYHLSNDSVYDSYLRDLFSLSNKYVVIFSNSTESYHQGVNERSEYVRFRDVIYDVQNRFPQWALIRAEPNDYPFNPCSPDSTSFADFYVFEKSGSPIDWESRFYAKKSSNQLVENAGHLMTMQGSLEKRDQKTVQEIAGINKQLATLVELLNKAVSEKDELKVSLAGLTVELENSGKELLDAKRNLSQVSHSKKIIKRRMEKLESATTYHLAIHIRNAVTSVSGFFRFPFAVFKIAYRKLGFQKKVVNNTLDNSSGKTKSQPIGVDWTQNNIERVVFSMESRDTVKSIVYADIDLNVVDGSSVWFTSMVNILACQGEVVVVLKRNLSRDILIAGINKEKTRYVYPSDFGLNELVLKDAVQVCHKLDRLLPAVERMVVRGLDASYLFHETRQFKYRSAVYLTDFYQYGDSGRGSTEEQISKVEFLARQADAFLVQTKQLSRAISDISSVPVSSFLLPPPIPSIKAIEAKIDNSGSGTPKIIYAGKITPQWGVIELLDWVEKLKTKGVDVDLTVIADKISAGKNGRQFRRLIHRRFKEVGVNYIDGMPRLEVLKYLLSADLVWCYRPAALEDSTIELSTKLIEAVSLSKPAIAYPSCINVDTLGEDYPYFIKDYTDFANLISSEVEFDMGLLSSRVKNIHGLDSIAERFSVLYSESARTYKKVLVAGHDMKFIEPYVSWLKSQGNLVECDLWEWGEAQNIERSEKCLKQADVILCEWGLANAVWYSRKNTEGKPLFIRIHLQEINPRARKFGPQIDISNVTKVIFVSERVRGEALSMWGWPKEKTIVIPNFVLDDEYLVSPRKNTKVVLGIVGIVPQRKRLDRAVELLELLVSQGVDATLQIKGQRPEELEFMHAPGRREELVYYNEVYRKIDSSSELAARVVFSPWGNDVATWYDGIDFILSCSDFESFHYALADGVLAGCKPLVWPWDEASAIYKDEWLVSDTVAAAIVVNNHLKLDRLSRESEQTDNRNFIISRYGKKHIFDRLNEEIYGS